MLLKYVVRFPLVHGVFEKRLPATSEFVVFEPVRLMAPRPKLFGESRTSQRSPPPLYWSAPPRSVSAVLSE